MDLVALLQVACALLVNASFAWLLGACCARRWARAAGMGDVAPALRLADLFAAAVGVLAGALALLVATAVMGGVGLREACPMFWMMLTGTDYGRTGSVAVLAIVAVFTLRLMGRGRGSAIAAMLALAVFALARASMGHAGEEGIWTLIFAAEAVHLAAIGLWAGVVFVSALLVLRASNLAACELHSTAAYLDAMSRAAMLAVLAITITGVYSGWNRVGTAHGLLHTDYGVTLLVKVGLVMIALALGGYNKFIGLPAARRSHDGVRRVRTVLQIESAVLLGALLSAAVLTAQQPPAAM